MKLPLRHQDTKLHKGFIIKDLLLVQLRAFAPPPVPDGTFGRVGGKKNTFRSGLKSLNKNN
jgi:hypothetical protein